MKELTEKEKKELAARAAEVILEKMNGWLDIAGEKGTTHALSDAFLDGVQWLARRALAEGFLNSL